MSRREKTNGSRVAAAALLALCALVPLVALAREQPAADEPRESGVEERVDVNLVLVDFLVIDGRGRVVRDLEIGDFKLKAAGKKIPIASLDRDCDQVYAPTGERTAQASTTAPAAAAEAAEPPRIVLVFDYVHMTETADVFARALDMLDRLPTGDEEHMIVSLNQILRIETPFTRDLDELRWTLRRMRNDRDLYAREDIRLTEIEFFERVRALFDMMERWPGRKRVVLFSGPFVRDGFIYDEQFRELGALATSVRTAVYPVDTAGMRTALDPDVSPLGGPPELRRLANETGGRMTAETNDITLAYARARSDLSCIYTLGFHDPDLKLDRDRGLKLRVVGRGDLRVVYPDFYVVRSEEEKQESLVDTAALAPHMFESPEVATRLFVAGARGDRWRVIVGTEIRAPAGASASAASWDLAGFLRKPNGTLVRDFEGRVRMSEGSADSVARGFHEFEAPPGEYALSVVLSGTEGEPRASTVPVTLPPVPRTGPFLVGPIAGHRSPDGFEPLLEPDAAGDRPLDALTVLCVAAERGGAARAEVSRRILGLDGSEVHRLADVSLDLAGSGLQCRELVDSLAVEGLAPGRYELAASATVAGSLTDEYTTEFVVPGGPE